MAEAIFNFPRGFLWGTATASHQVEGQNTRNNWYAWEQDGHIIPGHECGLACDWWGGRWREDFDRAAESSQNAHRLSVEWSRIQPTPERWDEDALDHYRQMLRGLVERGITPMATLHHFTLPLWLVEMGGWENEDAVSHFNEFSSRVVESLQEYCTLWCTLNEPNVLTTLGYLSGDFPPGKKSLSSLYQVVQNLVKAHSAAYHTIHEIQPHAQVGLAHHYRGFSPAKPWSPLDRWLTKVVFKLFNLTFPQTFHSGSLDFLGIRKSFRGAKGTQDFFGLNYYTREIVSLAPTAHSSLFVHTALDPQVEHSPQGFIANEPLTFFHSLKWAQGFGLPIYVTENGVEDGQDDFRRKYLIQHIHALWHAVNFTWPIRGYFHWSLVDNFEWERGWTQPFGLWALDPETQQRQKRPSADLYAAICAENALSSAMVTEFSPDLKLILFPG